MKSILINFNRQHETQDRRKNNINRPDSNREQHLHLPYKLGMSEEKENLNIEIFYPLYLNNDIVQKKCRC